MTTLCFYQPGHDHRPLILLKNAASEKRFITVLGEVHLPCWRFIVVRHGVHVHRDVFSLCKDNTSKDPFSQCEQLQGIARNSHAGEKSTYGKIDDD